MSVHLDALLSSKKVLLLQGPMGDFFAQLADWLNQKNIECYKLNFNGGDWLSYSGRQHIFHYRGKMPKFYEWLEAFVQENKIDSMVCFGDCRKYHRIANQVALDLGLQFLLLKKVISVQTILPLNKMV